MFNQEPLIKKAKSSPIYSTKNVTYNQLMKLIENDQLNPGSSYRITDYETMIASAQALLFRSAGHSFDLIVTALTENTLYDFAKATQREGDTYFASVNMGSWVIKYSPYNDPDKSPIASNTGKGVIYYMKDEWENECPYDFKNLQIYNETNALWYYTFNSLTDTDFSNTKSAVCGGNKIQQNYPGTAFSNVFISLETTLMGNSLVDCSNVVMIGSCNINTLKNVTDSRLDSINNSILINCTEIYSEQGGDYQMYGCSNIALGENCQSSYFTNCSDIVISTNRCKSNSFFGVKNVVLDSQELFGKDYSHIITQG